MSREELINEWIAGRLSTEDLDKKIAGAEDADQLKEIISRSQMLDVPKKRTKEEAWQLLSSQIEAGDHAKVVRLNPSIIFTIAASVALIALASYFIFTLPESVEAPRGQHISHLLPDGSQVWLNADSEISYRNFGQDEDRKVKLTGEAYFDVKKGGSFEVIGENGTVTVLGTSFNVNLRDNTLAVSCFKGSVVVKNKTGQSQTLRAGQSTRSAEQTLTPATRFKAEKEASWLTGDFYFEAAPLEKVFAELERQFNVDIVYKRNDVRTYTGYFNNSNLDEALQLIFQPMSLPYRKEGDKIYVE